MHVHDEYHEMHYAQQMFEQNQHHKEVQNLIRKQMQVVPALVPKLKEHLHVHQPLYLFFAYFFSKNSIEATQTALLSKPM